MGTRPEGPEGPIVLLKLGTQLFGLRTAEVSEMVLLPEVHAVPDAPGHVRGVVNLRGKVIALVDLRVRAGMPPAGRELAELLAVFLAREQDHRNWIAQLEVSIREGRPFTLATDPHQCAFGRWYDSLKSDNLVLTSQLRKIDAPHQQIHRRGAEALAAAARGDRETAGRIAEEIRTRHLAETLALFAETRVALEEAHREIAVVIQGAGATFAAAVDSVESVEPLDEVALDGATRRLLESHADIVRAVRIRPRDGRLVMMLEPARIRGGA